MEIHTAFWSQSIAIAISQQQALEAAIGFMGDLLPILVVLLNWSASGRPAIKHPYVYVFLLAALAPFAGIWAVIAAKSLPSAFYIGITFPTTVIAWCANVKLPGLQPLYEDTTVAAKSPKRRPRYTEDF